MSRVSTQPASLVTGSWATLAEYLCDRLAPSAAATTRLEHRGERPLILVPGGGVVDTLRRALATRFPLGTIPPEFVTPETLATNLTAGTLTAAAAFERRVAIDNAARKTPGTPPTRNPSALAKMAYRSWRDIRDAGLDPWSIDRSVPASERAAIRKIQAIWRTYEATLAELGLADPAEQMRLAIRRVRESGRGCFAVFGFYDATGLQAALIKALLQQSEAPIVLAPVMVERGRVAPGFDYAERFLFELGLHPSDATALPYPSRAIQAQPVTSRSAERASVCAQIRSSLLAGARADALGVVRRSLDPVEIELWQREAQLHGFRFAVPRAIPLRMHRFGRSMSLLLQIRSNGYRRNEIIDLLESGLTSLDLFSGRSAQIDHALRRLNLASGHPGDLARRAALESDIDQKHVDDYAAVFARVERLTARVQPSLSAAEWSSILQEWVGELKPASEEDLAAITALEEITAQLRGMGRVPVLAEQLLEELEGTVVTAESGAAGVVLADFMEARGRTFQELFIVAAEEGKLPQGRTEDALFPDEVRDRINLRRIGSGEAEERMLFELLLGAAAKTIVVWAESDDRGRATRPSPLLVRRLTDQCPADAVEILDNAAAWCRSKFRHADIPRVAIHRDASNLARRGQISPPAARTLLSIAEAGEGGARDGYLSGGIDAFPALRERLSSLSPTALERYGVCPQHFLLRTILRVDELSDPEDVLDLDARRKGSVTHSILESFYRKHTDEALVVVKQEPTPQSRIRLLLAPLVEAEFRSEDSVNPPRLRILRDIERENVIDELTSFLMSDLSELATSGFRPAHFEYTFGTLRDRPSSHPDVELEFGSLRLLIRGSIDRVDLHPDGRVRISDYKLGRASKYADIRQRILRGRNLQLALYCRAWANINNVPDTLIEAQILGTGVTGNRERFGFEFGQVAPRLKRILELFAEGMVGGRFPAFPGDHCRYCPVEQTCRTRNDPAELLELSRYEDVVSMLWPGEDWS